MIIAFSGTAGSGKSTIAKMLAKKLGYEHYSMGDMQRKIADEMGLTIVELGELEKTDDSIDKRIDDYQTNLGKTKDNFVIDAWLSPHFIRHAVKIYMDCDIRARAQRIMMREPEHYTSLDAAVKDIRKRERTNRQRWIKYYGYDFADMSNYDIVIDTTGKSIDEVFDTTYKKIKELSS